MRGADGGIEELGSRLLLGLLWLFRRLPLAAQAACGRALGRLGWRLLAGRRKVALRNLELCFPALAADERERRACTPPLARGVSLASRRRGTERRKDCLILRIVAVLALLAIGA